MFSPSLHVLFVLLITIPFHILADEESEIEEEELLRSEDVNVVHVSEGILDELQSYWADQGISAIMATIADKKLQELSPLQQKRHSRCAKRAHNVHDHSKCVSQVINWHKQREKLKKKWGNYKVFDFHPSSYYKKGRPNRKPLDENTRRKNDLLWKNYRKHADKKRKLNDSADAKTDSLLKKKNGGGEIRSMETKTSKKGINHKESKDQKEDDSQWIGSFRMRMKREIDEMEIPQPAVRSRQHYSIPDGKSLNTLGLLMRRLTNTIQLLKNKPVDNRRWQDRVMEIKEAGMKLQKKEKARNVQRKRMQMIEETVRALPIDVGLPLEMMNMLQNTSNSLQSDSNRAFDEMDKMFGTQNMDEELSIDNLMNFDGNLNLKDPKLKEAEKLTKMPIQLLRDGLKLAMMIAGKDTKGFDKKSIRMFSPKLLEMLPDKKDTDTINLFSPKLLTMHNESSNEVEQMLSVQNAMKFLQDNNQQEMMNFLLEATGVGDVVQKIKAVDKAKDTLEESGIDPNMFSQFGDPETVAKILGEKLIPVTRENDGLEDVEFDGGESFFEEIKEEIEKIGESNEEGESSGEIDDDLIMDEKQFNKLSNKTKGDLYKIEGVNGTQYLTKRQIKKLYGKEELVKVILFEKLKESFTKEQYSHFRKTGMAVLTRHQRTIVYGSFSPFANEKALKDMNNVTEENLAHRIEEVIHNVALQGKPHSYSFRKENMSVNSEEKEGHTSTVVSVRVPIVPKSTTDIHKRVKRWGVVGAYLAFTPVVRGSAMASQPFILTPIIFSPLILTPSVFGALILSPWIFTPAILSPKALSPTVLSPPLFCPVVLSPLLMNPIVLSPGVGVPIILSPFCMSPFILSPQVMTPLVLSPLVLSPIILTPHALTPLILSPFVLTPIILSPGYVGGLVLSPSALSPGVLSQGAIFTAILSPSVLS